MLRLPTHWARFGTSIFSRMTAAANAAQAINLAQGFPDFDGPDAIKEAAAEAILRGPNQYAPSPGIAPLRQALAERQKLRSGLTFDPDQEVTVFSGATEGIFCATLAVCEPGDEIVTFAPYYDSYPAAAFAAGAKLRSVELKAPHWSFDEAELRAAITPRTRAILVNTPHNPTGRVFTHGELTTIAQLAEYHNLIIITDEVYEELTFGQARHIHMATLAGARERTITLSSTSKTFSFTGWKIGYGFAPAPLTDVIRAVHQFTVFCSATPLQAGMVAGVKLGQEYFEGLRAYYQERLHTLLAILRQAGFRVEPPQGSYFVLADYSQISSKSDVEFALWLTEKAKVAAVPVSVFFDDPTDAASRLKYVRFAFCKRPETLAQAAEKFQAFFRHKCLS